MYAEIFKLVDERLKANEEQLMILDYKIENLEKELKEKDAIIKKQGIIIAELRTPCELSEGGSGK